MSTSTLERSDTERAAALRIGAAEAALAHQHENHVSVVDGCKGLQRLSDGADNLAHILPSMFNLEGRPYTLNEHPQFERMFTRETPPNSALKAARQCGKTQTLTTRAVMFANMISEYKMLFITPLSDQARRISSDYVTRLIETSPMYRRWVTRGCDRGVWRKSFSNRSLMHFSFAGLSADRTRGLAVNELNLDESFHPLTRVIVTSNGMQFTRHIIDVNPGDTILSFDNHGCLAWDKVISNSDHGQRACFKILTRGGYEITATAESWLATDRGWRRVSQIIDSLAVGEEGGGETSKADDAERTDQTAGADDSRNLAGGRELESCGQISSLSEQPRMVPGRVQLDQVPNLVRVCLHSTREEEEQRLRRLLERLRYPLAGGVRLLVLPDSSARPQGSEPGLAGGDRGGRPLGIDRMVGRRRRQPTPLEGAARSYKSPHGGFPEGGGGVATGLAHEERDRMRSAEDRTEREGLLHSQVHRSRNGKTGEVDYAVYAATDALQGYVLDEARDSGLLVLRADFSLLQRKDQLRQLGVPEEVVQRPEYRVESQTRQPRKDKLFNATEVSRKSHKVQDKSYRNTEEVHGKAPRSRAGSSQATAQGSRSQKTGSDRDLQSLSAAFSGTKRESRTLRRRVQESLSGCGEAEVRLIPSEIVSITYIGEIHTRDLETERHHTFVAGGIGVHNCADIAYDHLSVIGETLSASKSEVRRYHGTPKTMDNTMETLWRDSSQAEWVTVCQACNFHNYATVDLHLDKMIGPWREDISESSPGLVCANSKCCRPINPGARRPDGSSYGYWHHRRPELALEFPGFHLSQPIMHIHYSRAQKWATMLSKREGNGGYTRQRFLNEVLGESAGTGIQLVSEPELRAASTLAWENDPNDPRKVLPHLGRYKKLCLSVDWGGGGEKGMSMTVVVLIGLETSGRIHIIWGKRIMQPGHLEQAEEIMELYRLFGCQHLAHDFTGAGAIREVLLWQKGIPYRRLIPIAYGSLAGMAHIKMKPKTKARPRAYYLIDKPKSLQTVCHAIRTKFIKFFAYDFKSANNRGLINDFLALQENLVDRPSGSPIYTIMRNPNLPDDFAQAVNIGAVGLWHATNTFPDFAQAESLKRTLGMIRTTEDGRDSDEVDDDIFDELEEDDV